jgi:phosphate transport system protein
MISLRRAILTMGSSVQARVDQAFEAFLERDVDQARRIRGSDREIDEMEVDIEGECLRVLALCHPVAHDLRFVLATIRIDNDLERIADHAKSIAKRVIDLNDLQPIEIPPTIYTMAQTAREMLADALRALANEDAELAARVRASDQAVDDIQKSVFTWAQEQIPQDVGSTRTVIDVLSVIRAIERIADLATNVAEDVMFIVDGQVVRHRRG